ncbi:HD domain-containing phosphohydrolase [Aeromonas veronii]|uniref:HD domain-containing phosphohydrolase n=1 Tax=Aeromonas veronii TaxID=654 RepID=UPI0019201861|nr:HD domain-containing phosphohydrolase [Aeromonas veronii]MBL0480924.1 GAF domain-containing protein [Aeromonas veronii]HEA3125448.1 GAF domain-containing protein [Aeromonas veronii]
MSLIRRVIPLYVHIAHLFLGLLLVFALITLGHQYRQTKTMLMKEAEERFSLIGQITTQALEGLFSTSALSVNLLAQQRLTEAKTLSERMASLPYMTTLLKGQPSANAVYAGYNNGDLFWLMRWPADTEVQHLTPPANTRWIVKSIRHQEATTLTETFALADNLTIIERQEESGQFFDPIEHPWFIQAKQSGQLVQSPLYISHDTQEMYLSFAEPMQNGAGVIGMSLNLRAIERLLKSAKITPNMRLAIVNEQGELMTSHKGGMVIHEHGAYRLARVTEADLPMIQHLMNASQNQKADSLSFKSEGNDWQGMRITLPEADGSKLILWIAAPVDELLATAFTIRNQTFLLSGIFLIFALFAAIKLARTAARPLDDLTQEAGKIAHFDFNDPIRVNSYIAEIIDLSQAMGDMKSTIQRFLQLSTSLSSETSFPRLLVRLLTEMQQLTGATGCMLYLSDSGNKTLDLAGLCWNGEVQEQTPIHSIGTLNQPKHPLFQSLQGVELEPVALVTSELQILFPYVEESDTPLTFWPIALKNRDGQLLGTLVFLIDERKKSLTPQRMAFVNALSSTAAVALTTQRLLEEQRNLLEAFIQLIAGAIDAKSPYTGGHCQRVPELTKMLAEAACEAKEGPFQHFSLDEKQWEAIHIAAWLHDCGKVTTPEFVVDKATKLETLCDRIHEVRMRFEVLKRDAEIAYWQARLHGGDEATLQATLQQQWQQLDEEFAFIARCNEGGEFMATEDIARLQQIAGRTWQRTLSDRIGISQDELARKQRATESPLPVTEPLLADRPDHLFTRSNRDRLAPDNPWGFQVNTPEYLYNRGELYNLAIRRGTLTDEERYKINEHMTQTIIMLEKLPFPANLKQVPEIAGGHHEKMDGTGYPKRLKRDEMSIPARMMAIADIFEALTAGDRPYKKAKSLSEAIRIMGFMQQDHHIDPELFALFLRSGVYLRYAKRYMSPELIDEVDISPYLASH